EGRKYGLPKKGRPTFLNAWIHNGRTRNGKRAMLGSDDAVKMFREWGVWCDSMAPAWRKQARVDWGATEWKQLQQPGQNGLLSLVAILSWWRSYCAGNGEVGLATWKEEEKEVRLMMMDLLRYVRKKKI
ncbi:hypothetical protein BDZ89DRAFT_1052074, partial [Hymenopellis radicata]